MFRPDLLQGQRILVTGGGTGLGAEMASRFASLGAPRDDAVRAFGGMGMTKELPLQQMANEARLMRLYEGPTEVHRMVIARNTLGRTG